MVASAMKRDTGEFNVVGVVMVAVFVSVAFWLLINLNVGCGVLGVRD